jgi:hypothetical protein
MLGQARPANLNIKRVMLCKDTNQRTACGAYKAARDECEFGLAPKQGNRLSPNFASSPTLLSPPCISLSPLPSHHPAQTRGRKALSLSPAWHLDHLPRDFRRCLLRVPFPTCKPLDARHGETDRLRYQTTYLQMSQKLVNHCGWTIQRTCSYLLLLMS